MQNSSEVLRAAGKSLSRKQEGTAYCLRFDERPQTPEQVKLYRTNYEPGARLQHPALVRDGFAQSDRRYGVSTSASDHVTDVFPHGPQTEMGQRIQEKAEAQYQRTKKEPLGRSVKHGHKLPQHVSDPDYAFGVKTQGLDKNAKDLIFPEDQPPEEVPEHLLRFRTQLIPPGVPKRHAVEWEKLGIDPSRHRFGKSERAMLKDGQGAALALKPDLDPGANIPKVVPKAVADVRKVHSELLGTTKSLSGSSDPTQMPFPAGAIKRSDEFTAEDCIVGGYSIEEQLPDQDLGRSVRPGFRNFTKDPNRVFGLPSIRRDIPKKTSVSIADDQNYGDGPSAAVLLRPSAFAELGVDDNDFVEPRNQREIRDIFERIGYSLDDGEFRAIWRRAADHYDLNGNGVVSIEEFRLALNEYLDAQDEGKTPDWFTE